MIYECGTRSKLTQKQKRETGLRGQFLETGREELRARQEKRKKVSEDDRKMLV